MCSSDLDFTHILSVSRIGDTGETYAFNDEGVLVSNSRFDPQLVSMGLLQPEDNSIFNIQIRDPGRDLTIKKLRPGGGYLPMAINSYGPSGALGRIRLS